MDENESSAWRDEPEFAAIRGVVEWMDEGNARYLSGLVDQNCATLAQAIREPNAFRKVVSLASVATLAELYSYLDLLIPELEQCDAALTNELVPWVVGFRDIVGAEGIRRGSMFAKGHDPRAEALAACVVLTLGFSPGPKGPGCGDA